MSSSSSSVASMSVPDVIEASDEKRTTGNLRLFTREQIAKSTQRLHGVSPEEERRMRCTACTFIANAGKDLQFKQLAIATASVYLHTFFMKFSFRKYDRYTVASVCLFLAGKVEEQRRKVKDVATVCYHLRKKTRLPPDSPELNKICDSMLDMEMLVLQTIEFNFHPSHPYLYCMTTLKKIFATSDSQLSREDQKAVAQYAWYLINDSLKSTMSLIHPPEPIALACIDASAKLMNQQKNLLKLAPDWYTVYYSSMTETCRKEIIHEVLAVLDLDPASQRGDRKVLRARLQLVDQYEAAEKLQSISSKRDNISVETPDDANDDTANTSDNVSSVLADGGVSPHQKKLRIE